MVVLLHPRPSLRQAGRAWPAPVVILLVALPFATAGTMTWDTLEDDLPAAVHGLDVAHGRGFAVGEAGLILRLDGEEWLPVASPTDRTLHDVRIFASDHAVAVGADGVVLEYERAFDAKAGHPSGVSTAYGATGDQRRTEWAVPLWRVHAGPGDTFGMGVEVRAGSAAQRHPSSFQPALARTAEAIVFNDLPYGTPAVDGQAEPIWTGAVHASYTTGPAPFSLYLLRDDTNLYVLAVGADGVALDHVLLQFHRNPGGRPVADDLRLERAGTTTATLTHGIVGTNAAWQTTAAPGTLGITTLYGAAFLPSGLPVAAGTGGSLLLPSTAGWIVQTLATDKTLRAVDVRFNGHVYAVGGALAGNTGAAIYRYTPSGSNAVTVPPGTYGLHDIDLASCRAVGSGGAILTCVDGNPNAWTLAWISNSVTLMDVLRDENDPTVTWAAGRTGTDQPALYRNDGSATWQSWGLPSIDPGPVTALTFGLGGPIVAVLGLDIFILRGHAPMFTSYPPSTVTGPQGQPIHIPFQTFDDDNDPIQILVDPPDGVPPEDINIINLDDDWYEIVWTPDPNLEGLFDIQITLSDGDFTVTNGTTVIIIDDNFPPYWDPHPDVTIPASVPWSTTAQAYDPDNDPLLLTAITLPPGAVFADLGSGTAQVDWTPTPAQVGAHLVTLRASDGALTADLTFTVTVIDNEPPDATLGPQNPIVCVAGPYWSGTITFHATAQDPEGGPLNYTWTFSDDNSTAYGPSATHTYTQLGTFTVSVTITDIVGNQITLSTTVRIDDCIHVEGEVDADCFNIIEKASGFVTISDHTGAPTNGTYRVRAWWDPPVGSNQYSETTGDVVNGIASWVLPYDHDPLPLGDPVLHRVYIEGIVTDTLHGDTERITLVDQYFHSPHCRLVEQPLF